MRPTMRPPFPNESAGYREARNALLEAEEELRERIEEVATLRRELPLGGRVEEDYVFDELDAHGEVRQVRLSDLFAPGKDSLFLYSYMYGPEMEEPCVMCTSILDGLEGNAPHIEQRMNLAVAARSPIERVERFARDRGWRHLRLLSSANNTYHPDYFGEDEDGSQWPMANVFVRRDGAVHHFWGSELMFRLLENGNTRHVDLLWPLWNVFDLTPEGRGETWYPKLRYGE